MKKTRSRAIYPSHIYLVSGISGNSGSLYSVYPIYNKGQSLHYTANCKTVPLGLQFSHPTLRLFENQLEKLEAAKSA